MYIRYKLYRSSNLEEVFNAEMIEVLIENDKHLAFIDKVITDVLTRHLSDLPQVKKYGIAYVGRMEIVNIEITDKDNISLTEDLFRAYMQEINMKLPVIWNRTSNDKAIKENLVKLEFNEN